MGPGGQWAGRWRALLSVLVHYDVKPFVGGGQNKVLRDEMKLLFCCRKGVRSGLIARAQALQTNFIRHIKHVKLVRRRCCFDNAAHPKAAFNRVRRKIENHRNTRFQ